LEAVHFQFRFLKLALLSVNLAQQIMESRPDWDPWRWLPPIRVALPGADSGSESLGERFMSANVSWSNSHGFSAKWEALRQIVPAD